MRQMGRSPPPYFPETETQAALHAEQAWRSSLTRVPLEIQNKSLWILGINQDRNQAAFCIGWLGVHDPGPKGIGSPAAGIGPRSSEVIVVT